MIESYLTGGLATTLYNRDCYFIHSISVVMFPMKYVATTYYPTVHSSLSVYQSFSQQSLRVPYSSSHLFASPPQLASDELSQSFTHCSDHGKDKQRSIMHFFLNTNERDIQRILPFSPTNQHTIPMYQLQQWGWIELRKGKTSSRISVLSSM